MRLFSKIRVWNLKCLTARGGHTKFHAFTDCLLYRSGGGGGGTWVIAGSESPEDRNPLVLIKPLYRNQFKIVTRRWF